MLTFLHAADIHLDSPLHNLDLYEGAPVEEFRQVTRRAFENLITIPCISLPRDGTMEPTMRYPG